MSPLESGYGDYDTMNFAKYDYNCPFCGKSFTAKSHKQHLLDGCKAFPDWERGRLDGLDEAVRALENASINSRAKYTCCLENGLNARIIGVEVIKKLKVK